MARVQVVVRNLKQKTISLFLLFSKDEEEKYLFYRQGNHHDFWSGFKNDFQRYNHQSLISNQGIDIDEQIKQERPDTFQHIKAIEVLSQ